MGPACPLHPGQASTALAGPVQQVSKHDRAIGTLNSTQWTAPVVLFRLILMLWQSSRTHHQSSLQGGFLFHWATPDPTPKIEKNQIFSSPSGLLVFYAPGASQIQKDFKTFKIISLRAEMVESEGWPCNVDINEMTNTC